MSRRRRTNAGSTALILAALALASAVPAGASPDEPEARRGSGQARTSVIGGHVAQPGALPWLAYVRYYHRGISRTCSGTVVAPNLVLTAGHCVPGAGLVTVPAGFMVVTGVVDRTSTDRQVSRVSRVMTYPGYRPDGGFTQWGDAALLELSAPTTAPAIELAAHPFWQQGGRALMAGWGSAHGRGPVPWLRWATTYIQGGRWCRLFAAGHFHLRGQICTIKPPKNDSGTCLGDSGGPLLAVRPGSRELQQIGIVTSGHVSCSTRWPTVFTRADLVARWVSDRIREQPP